MTDTDDNAADFAVGAPTPVNSRGQGPGTPDPDPEPEPGDKRIRDIQGTTRVSPLLGQKVSGVPGVVTATRATGDRGFWIQDTAPDTDPRTSEGVFVYTAGLAPTVEPGDAVLVSGTVAEYRPGGDAARLGYVGNTDKVDLIGDQTPVLEALTAMNPTYADEVAKALGEALARIHSVPAGGFYKMRQPGVWDFPSEASVSTSRRLSAPFT